MPVEQLVTPEIRAMIGKESTPRYAVDLVTTSEVRRWVTATLDDSPIWHDPEAARNSKFGESNAPGPFPMRAVGHWKRALGLLPDPVRQLDFDDDFRYGDESLDDPNIKITWPEGVGSFHAGNEVEYFQFPKVGDQIGVVEKIVDIEEKVGRSGKLAVVHVDYIFTNQDGDVLIINHGTNIAREMPEGWREKRAGGH
jgi:acyl dehydratase